MKKLYRSIKCVVTHKAFAPSCMVAMACLVTFAPDVVHAAAADGTLDSVYGTLSDWAEGSVGKVVMLAFILVGIVAGIAKQSLLAFAIGIGAGLGIYNAPTIVDTIFGAVLK